MKYAPRKPMVSAIIAVLVLISPIYAESASNLERYLDCSSEKKIDIVFVFDTTNSMGGEISELRATANKFATDLEASNIDYQLGLVEFRDFPETCDGFSCGSPGDYAYSVKGDGILTSEIDTFGSWLKELKAGGGGSQGPEAVLAALRHAGSDLSWRSDAEKVIVVLTDAGAHPDGSCCNAEGDTLEGTIFELVDIGARAYIIGPEDASLEKIAENTGGQFYEIRSGLSLKPLLEEITKSLGCSFRTDVATACENNQMEVSVQLIGKETIPYISGQTEAWMYLDQAGSISRVNLSYDQEAKAYLASVPDICGSVELTVYGRAGERSAVQTAQVECSECAISNKTFDGSNVGDSFAYSLQPAFDGGYILAGYTENPGRQAWVIKTDADGIEIWNRTFGRQLDQVDAQAYSAMPTTDGGYIIAATAFDLDAKGATIGGHAWLIKIDDEGRMAWNKTIGPRNSRVEVARPTLDGGYILCGYENWLGDADITDTDAFLIKTDSEGNIEWNKTFRAQGSTYSRLKSVQQTSDRGYIGVGYATPTYDAWLIKTDSLGNKEWERFFLGYSFNFVQSTSDDGYILAGGTDETGGIGGKNGWLIKTDALGKEIWNSALNYLVCSAHATSDGGYILVGTTEVDGYACLIKTDSKGKELWNRTFVEEGIYGIFSSVHPTNDGGYMLAGHRTREMGIDERAWLVKVDADGYIISQPDISYRGSWWRT